MTAANLETATDATQDVASKLQIRVTPQNSLKCIKNGRTVVNAPPVALAGDRVQHWEMLPANTGGPACMVPSLSGNGKIIDNLAQNPPPPPNVKHDLITYMH